MKKLLVLTIAILMSSCYSFAQEKKLDIKDAVIGQWRDLAPERISRLNWIPESDSYYFLDSNKLKKSSVKEDEKVTILSLDELNELLNLKEKNKLRRFPSFSWLNSQTIQFSHNNKWFKINPYDGKILDSLTLSIKAANEDYCDKNNHFAYTIENNLFVADYSGNIKRISNEDNEEIIYGQEVHRREFGINTGTFWSPDGKNLAFYRKDESMVTDYPLVDITSRVAELKKTDYPMAGMKSHHVKVGVYNLNSENITYLKTGKPLDKYLTNVKWGPDGKFIYIAELNRDQDHMKMQQFDAETGELVKTLFEEKDEKYVEPLISIKFLSDSDKKFIWTSRRDGYNHIYLFNTEGEMLKQLTKGRWEVSNSSIEFDKSGKNIFFSANKQSPIEQHTYKVNVKSGDITLLTEGEGIHRSKVSSSGNYIIDHYSSQDNPGTTQIVNNKGEQLAQLLQADNPLKDYNLGEAKIGTVKAVDGETDLYYRLIKPANFDPDKKYPAIIYVYGGPHAQLVRNSWLASARMWQYYMAQKGYVMLTLDNRGSANRGLEFESAIYRNLGKHEIADQMQGVKILENLDYVDTSRIGVHGWSYGGFLTTSLMLKKPETFKVGVAGGPVIDWKYYEVMYGERYMDKPQQNPEGYENANLKNYATNLKGDLKIIHGYIDDVVVPQHSLSFIRTCVKNDVPLDFFFYPRHKHNVRGMDRIHLMKKVTEYFEENL
jgi:dipeptidyl-peptidase-4